jgi:hypothetical protein
VQSVIDHPHAPASREIDDDVIGEPRARSQLSHLRLS